MVRIVASVAAGLVLLASPSLAGTRSFSFPINAATPSGGATLSGPRVRLPHTGTSGFTIDFVLPADYQANGNVQVVLYLDSELVLASKSSRAAPPCTARLVPALLERRRLGKTGVSDFAGLVPKNDSSQVTIPDLATTVPKAFLLKRTGNYRSQRPGDAMKVGIRREADDVQDDCDVTLFVAAIDIRYPVP
jgi:hypothetical protein